MSSKLRGEYDFKALGRAERGRYAEAYRRGTNLVRLDDDVAAAFPDEKAVNEALRLLVKLAEQQVGKNILKP